ncbi:MAG: plasmid recombination protein [Bacteroidaceae bacterium]|nr:plasmid recombination protein [Bacteroidaceae bacterium]
MPKQMLEISTSKTVDNALGDYIGRTRNKQEWTKEDYDWQNNKGTQGRQYGVRDWSRASLNFEVVIGKHGKPVVQPIDHAKPSLQERWQQRIDEGYKAVVHTKKGDVRKPIKKSEIKIVKMELGGNRDRMHELAFDRKVNLGKRGIGTNGDVHRREDIEQWAIDCYNHLAKKYGAENIIDFVVHLDETNPHIHVTLVPLTQDGKLSYTELFGGSHAQAVAAAKADGTKPNFQKQMSEYTKQLHTDFFNDVGAKWGLDRGDDIKITGNTHKSTEESLREKNAIEEEIAQKDEQLQQKNSSVLTLSNRETQLQSRVEDLEEAERRADENLTAKNKMLAKIGIQPVRSKLSIEDENDRLAKEKEEALKIAREQKEKATAATRRAETARSEGAEEERRKDIAYDTEGKPMLRKNGTPWTNAEIRDWYSKQHKEDGEKIKALTAKTGLLKGLILPIIEAALDAIRWFFAYPHALNYGIDKDRVQTINEALGMVEDDARNELGKALVGYAASGYEKASHLTIEKLEDEVAMIAAGTHKHLAQGQGESVGLHK